MKVHLHWQEKGKEETQKNDKKGRMHRHRCKAANVNRSRKSTVTANRLAPSAQCLYIFLSPVLSASQQSWTKRQGKMGVYVYMRVCFCIMLCVQKVTNFVGKLVQRKKEIENSVRISVKISFFPSFFLLLPLGKKENGRNMKVIKNPTIRNFCGFSYGRVLGESSFWHRN